MAKSKHSFQKRQREVDKKKKREEKIQRKIDKKFQPTATFEEMLVEEVQKEKDSGVEQKEAVNNN